jgi:hypothetical protein
MYNWQYMLYGLIIVYFNKTDKHSGLATIKRLTVTFIYFKHTNLTFGRRERGKMLRKRKGRYLTYIGSYQRFGTTYHSPLKGTDRLSQNVCNYLCCNHAQCLVDECAWEMAPYKITRLFEDYGYTNISILKLYQCTVPFMNPTFLSPPPPLALRSTQQIGLLQDEFPGISWPLTIFLTASNTNFLQIFMNPEPYIWTLLKIIDEIVFIAPSSEGFYLFTVYVYIPE